MAESNIERYLNAKVKALGGLCMKFVSPGRRNVPDRIVLLPGGRGLFAEVKDTDETANSGQVREHDRYRALGHTVAVVDSKPAVDALLTKTNLTHVTGEGEWRYEVPQNKGALMFLLTTGRIAMRGPWTGDYGKFFIAWAPMPKRNKPLEDALVARGIIPR